MIDNETLLIAIAFSSAALMGALLIGWANIERLRFKGVKRRQGRPEVTVSQVANQYNLPENHLVNFRQKNH